MFEEVPKCRGGGILPFLCAKPEDLGGSEGSSGGLLDFFNLLICSGSVYPIAKLVTPDGGEVVGVEEGGKGKLSTSSLSLSESVLGRTSIDISCKVVFGVVVG